MKRIVLPWAILLLIAAAAPMSSIGSEQNELEPTDRHGKVSRLITTLFERSHFRQARVDDELSSRIFDRYLETLDANRQYFLASDIAEFEAYRNSLDESVKRGKVEPAFDMFRRYQQRAREWMSYSLEQLESEPDFTIAEEYRFDRSDLPWAKTNAELRENWRKRVKNDVLSLTLADKEWDEISELLTKRYTRVLKRIDQVTSDEVFETFMNAYAETLDPHTSYFSPRNAEEYRIQMSLSYDGIGASLQLLDDYVTVLDIIPGGPAAIDEQLKPKDRITAVGQEDGEMEDVVGWRLDEVVQLIRGPGGTAVRLQILPADALPGAPEEIISLRRDKIKLEAQAAKKEVVKTQREGHELSIGVITVPSFYQDFGAKAAGDKDYTSSTADVRRLVNELKAEDDIDGLIIDLRRNGGGNLSEATALSGLFIKDGPVVQLSYTGGTTEVLDDPIPNVVYDGPLAVLVNRYSASASEIFAAAIQDYGRGVVIGQQTFGKGSVQNLYDLDRFARGKDQEFGQLTLTIGKYYRVTGGSTQHRGVMPDITLPSVVDAKSVGESARDTALPWDEIDATPYRPDATLDAAITVLSGIHHKRAALDPDFSYLMDNIQALETMRARKSVSLELNARKLEREEQRMARFERENQRRSAHGLEPFGSPEEMEESEAPDFLLEEAAEIVTDMVDIAKMPPEDLHQAAVSMLNGVSDESVKLPN